MVTLLGTGPRLNVDFARLSFHVPTSELLVWAKAVPDAPGCAAMNWRSEARNSGRVRMPRSPQCVAPSTVTTCSAGQDALSVLTPAAAGSAVPTIASVGTGTAAS